jgi:hypothetical protein
MALRDDLSTRSFATHFADPKIKELGTTADPKMRSRRQKDIGMEISHTESDQSDRMTGNSVNDADLPRFVPAFACP